MGVMWINLTVAKPPDEMVLYEEVGAAWCLDKVGSSGCRPRQGMVVSLWWGLGVMERIIVRSIRLSYHYILICGFKNYDSDPACTSDSLPYCTMEKTLGNVLGSWSITPYFDLDTRSYYTTPFVILENNFWLLFTNFLSNLYVIWLLLITIWYGICLFVYWEWKTISHIHRWCKDNNIYMKP